jgi:hypothetical protein
MVCQRERHPRLSEHIRCGPCLLVTLRCQRVEVMDESAKGGQLRDEQLWLARGCRLVAAEARGIRLLALVIPLNHPEHLPWGGIVPQYILVSLQRSQSLLCSPWNLIEDCKVLNVIWMCTRASELLADSFDRRPASCPESIGYPSRQGSFILSGAMLTPVY